MKGIGKIGRLRLSSWWRRWRSLRGYKPERHYMRGHGSASAEPKK